jgi:hypothetical protein
MPDIDLDRIAHDANEAAKFVVDSLGTRVLEQDVPRLIAEVRAYEDGEDSRLAATRAMFNEANARLRFALLRALGIDDDGHSPLLSYVHTLAAQRDAYRAVVDAARPVIAHKRTEGDLDVPNLAWLRRYEANMDQLAAAVDALPEDNHG